MLKGEAPPNVRGACAFTKETRGDATRTWCL